MRRVVVGFALLVLSVGTVQAETSDRSLAIKYLQASRIQDAIDVSIAEYETSLVKKDATPEQKAKFHGFLEACMGWDAIKDQLADVVEQTYTKEELEASIAFMSTPAGASATAKSGEFSKRFSAILIANLKKAANQGSASAK